MSRIIIAAMVLSGSLTLCATAWAQTQISSTLDPEQTAGARVDVTGDGFQLITHGMWVTPTAPREWTPAREAAQRDKLNPLHQGYTARTKTNFRRAVFLPNVYAAEVRYGLPAGLLDALIWTESRYNPIAVSSAGAAGLGQLMPGTARDLGVTNRFNPKANLWGAARYMKQLLNKLGMVHLAIAAYNAGPGAVERARGIPLNGETPGYVRSVLEFWGSQ